MCIIPRDDTAAAENQRELTPRDESGMQQQGSHASNHKQHDRPEAAVLQRELIFHLCVVTKVALSRRCIEVRLLLQQHGQRANVGCCQRAQTESG